MSTRNHRTVFDRRRFVQTTAAAIASPWLLRGAEIGWDDADTILSRIRPPTFPDHQFDISDYGADPDGQKESSDAIRRAIAACSEAGGGRVVVPAGTFLTGAVHLRSNVNLHLSEGATLRFLPNDDLYLPVVYTRWEGVECMSYSALLYAFEQENIALTGSGTLDGQASDENWWSWVRRGGGNPTQTEARNRLFEMGQNDVPVSERVFGEGSYLRPNFVQLYRCRNILIEGVTVRNSPMWHLHPVLSENVTVRGVTVEGHGPNNDGCNPESCRDVLIEDCLFDTGDDCIAIKSGRNRDGRRVGVPSENIIVRGCQMKDGHGGVTIGSEASGSVRNVFAENCQMDSPNLDRVLRLKTNSVRGGTVENIFMRNVTVGEVADAVIRVNLFYEEGDAGDFPPTVRNIEMRNVTSRKSLHALYLRGYESDPVRDIRIIDCSFDNVAEPDVIENVDGLRLENVRVNGQPHTAG